MQTYVLNKLQWLSISASGKLSDRLRDMASEMPALIYQRIVIIYSTFRANPAKTGGLIFVTLISFPKLDFLYQT